MASTTIVIVVIMTFRFIQVIIFVWKLSVAISRRLVYCNNVGYSSEHPLAGQSNCGWSQTEFGRKIKATFVTYIAPYRTKPMSRSGRQHSYFVFERTRIHISARKPERIFVIFFPPLYANAHILSFFLAWQPQWARASSFTGFLDPTQERTIVSRTPLDEWSARRRGLYLAKHNTRNKHPCPRWHSKGQSQQAGGRRSTP